MKTNTHICEHCGKEFAMGCDLRNHQCRSIETLAALDKVRRYKAKADQPWGEMKYLIGEDAFSEEQVRQIHDMFDRLRMHLEEKYK